MRLGPELPRSVAAIAAVREGRLTDLQMGILTACEHAGEEGIPLSRPGLPRREADNWTKALGPLLLAAFVRMNADNNLALGGDGAKRLEKWRGSRRARATHHEEAEAGTA